MSEFTGKVALITGGNAGIGRATAIEFARRGAAVVISGRREKEGLEVVDEIASASRRRSRAPSPGSVPTARRSSSARRLPSTEAIQLSSSARQLQVVSGAWMASKR